MLLDVAKIKATPEAQPRVSLHYPTVEQYAEALRVGAEFPPVVVFFDGTDHWLADGFHRLEAYKLDEYVKIPVDIRKGSKRDAILYSVGANGKHGLPRTNEDKRRAVMVLLGDTEWSKKSDRWIAETAAVSHTLVQNLRTSTGNVASSASDDRRGKDGKTRKLPERKSDPAPNAEVAPREEKSRRPAEPDDAVSAPAPATEQQQPRPEPTVEKPTDPFHGCGNGTRRDAVNAWAEQGEMIFKTLGEEGRTYMLNQWAKRVKKLEGYAA